MMDILDELQADLDTLRSFVIEMRVADENRPEEAQAFTALVSMVKAQTEAQEKTLRPMAVRFPQLRHVLDATFDRFHGARDVEQIIECCTNVTTWRASVMIYCELLDTHMRKEAMDLMPTLYDVIPAKDRARLADTYRKLRGFEEPAKKMNWQRIWNSVLNPTG